MVGGARDNTDRLKAQDRIRFQASLLDRVGQAVIATDERGFIIYWNSTAESIYGWDAAEVLGRPFLELMPAPAAREEFSRVMKRIEAGETWNGEVEVCKKGGATFFAELTESPIFDGEEQFRGAIGISSDATERRDLDRTLRQAQKMEAIGRLAGGIAHDFNNVLTVILGRARMILEDLPKESPLEEDVGQIITASQRAASLTSRLLAFSRSQVLQEKVVDLADAAAEIEGLLRPLVPERIDLHFDVAKKGAFAKVDPAQLEQVLLNLTINARDAMPDRGSLTFRAESREFTPEEIETLPWAMTPGRYSVLSVEDTGTGIPADLMDRIFEPFFTTKPPGQGTGLGLSMGAAPRSA
jgi:PAS domain S-box-containing protein